MDTARVLARAGAPEWTVVVAEEQTGGRGRLGRRWYSPRGGLWMSVVLRPRLETGRTHLLNIAGALAVRDAVRSSYGVNAYLKWPNDVLVGGRKLACLLYTSPSPRD